MILKPPLERLQEIPHCAVAMGAESEVGESSAAASRDDQGVVEEVLPIVSQLEKDENADSAGRRSSEERMRTRQSEALRLFTKYQNHIGFTVLACAYCCIYPGLWWPTCKVRTGIFGTKGIVF